MVFLFFSGALHPYSEADFKKVGDFKKFERIKIKQAWRTTNSQLILGDVEKAFSDNDLQEYITANRNSRKIGF